MPFRRAPNCATEPRAPKVWSTGKKTSAKKTPSSEPIMSKIPMRTISAGSATWFHSEIPTPPFFRSPTEIRRASFYAFPRRTAIAFCEKVFRWMGGNALGGGLDAASELLPIGTRARLGAEPNKTSALLETTEQPGVSRPQRLEPGCEAEPTVGPRTPPWARRQWSSQSTHMGSAGPNPGATLSLGFDFRRSRNHALAHDAH